MFKNFDIDNYKEKFLQLGFTELNEEYEYECDYCQDMHFAKVFQKDDKKYYFNYEYKSVIEID